MSQITRFIGTDPNGTQSSMAKVIVSNAGFLSIANLPYDEKYTFRFWIKTSAIVNGIALQKDDTVVENIASTTSWQKITAKFEGTTGQDVKFYLPQGTYYFWHSKLEVGTMESDYSQSQKDFELQVVETRLELNSRINQTAESITHEVTRAKNAEENLSSKVEQTAESITSTVAKTQTVWLEEQPIGTPITIKYRDYGTPVGKTFSGLALNDLYLNVSTGQVYKMTNISNDTWTYQYTLTSVESHTETQIEQTNNQIVLKADNNGNLALVELGADPSTGTSFTVQADDISLAGKTIDLTSDRMAIISEHFNVNYNGETEITSEYIYKILRNNSTDVTSLYDLEKFLGTHDSVTELPEASQDYLNYFAVIETWDESVLPFNKTVITRDHGSPINNPNYPPSSRYADHEEIDEEYTYIVRDLYLDIDTGDLYYCVLSNGSYVWQLDSPQLQQIPLVYKCVSYYYQQTRYMWQSTNDYGYVKQSRFYVSLGMMGFEDGAININDKFIVDVFGNISITGNSIVISTPYFNLNSQEILMESGSIVKVLDNGTDVTQYIQGLDNYIGFYNSVSQLPAITADINEYYAVVGDVYTNYGDLYRAENNAWEHIETPIGTSHRFVVAYINSIEFRVDDTGVYLGTPNFAIEEDGSVIFNGEIKGAVLNGSDAYLHAHDDTDTEETTIHNGYIQGKTNGYEADSGDYQYVRPDNADPNYDETWMEYHNGVLRFQCNDPDMRDNLQCGISERGMQAMYVYYEYLSHVSDKRVKENFRKLGVVYEDAYYEIQPLIFNLIGNTTNEIGLIAQDLEEVLIKYNMCENNPFIHKVKDKKLGEKYTLDYTKFIIYNMHMIQKQHKEIESLKSEIAELKDMIKSLMEK